MDNQNILRLLNIQIIFYELCPSVLLKSTFCIVLDKESFVCNTLFILTPKNSRFEHYVYRNVSSSVTSNKTAGSPPKQ
jgi:hypothetical protein